MVIIKMMVIILLPKMLKNPSGSLLYMGSDIFFINEPALEKRIINNRTGSKNKIPPEIVDLIKLIKDFIGLFFNEMKRCDFALKLNK